MATFNTTSSGVAATAAEQFQRSASTTTTFLVPATTTTAPLQLESFVSAAPHFVGAQPPIAHAHSTQHHQPHPHQHQHQHHQQTTNATSSSYTFVQIKREPCQVSEVSSNQPSTTANGSHHPGVGQAAALTSISGASSKTMSSSTLTTLVKIEASSPKVHDMDKSHVATLNATPAIASTNNSVPIGIAVARKRPQESTSSALGATGALPVPQTLNKDMNCFGIRVADLGGVGTGCGNIFFTGNGELMTSTATAEELALNAAGVNRAPSTYWQYPNALPIESVISMSPATVGLQYSREASRGQVVLLPAPAAALGISNFPLYTPTDPFQQAAAAFVWPSYIPQGAAPTATPPNFGSNFIFPSMSPHSTLQPQSYATSLQLFGSNYLTAAAAAAAAAAATSTLCQHNQQTNSSTSSINLSLGGPVGGSSTSTTSSSSSTSRFLSVTPAITGEPASKHPKHLATTTTLQPLQPQPLLVPPTALKIEEWNATEFMASAAKTTTTTLSAQNHQLVAPLAAALNYEARDKTTTTTTTTTNLLELQANGHSLNLMRLPTPPTSATMENAATQAAAPTTQLQQPIGLFQSSSPAPAVINLAAAAPAPLARPAVGTTITPNGLPASFLNVSSSSHTATPALTTAIGPPTPHSDEQPTIMKFKNASLEAPHPQIVIGVPRLITNASQQTPGPLPQMQDVNIQTDTPVCSEDESSSCPIAIQQQQQILAHDVPQNLASNGNYYAHDTNAQQPLELTKASSSSQAQSQVFNEITPGSSERLIESTPAPTPSTTKQSSPNNNGPECHSGNTPPDNINDAMHPKGMPNQAELTRDMKFSEAMMQSVDTTMSAPLSATATASATAVSAAAIPSAASSSTTADSPEDLTGLELLSNISASTLAKNNVSSVRIKQEPVEHSIGSFAPKEEMKLTAMNGGGFSEKLLNQRVDMASSSGANLLEGSILNPAAQAACRQVDGLSLLCALAEQRIQEESSGNLFATCTSSNYDGEDLQKRESSPEAVSSHVDSFGGFGRQSPASTCPMEQTAFPSMEGIELPSTSGVSEHPVKRKKRKHSKSSKSSTQEKKKSQKSGRKKQKKYSKEKRKHKLSPKTSDLDEAKLQEELKSALDHVDPNYNQFGNWCTPAELFKIMETDMRMRLADITRQYHKKKRKLEEINKKRKKRKCSKLVAQQQLQQQQQQLQLQMQQQQQQTNALALSASIGVATNGGSSHIHNSCNGLSSTSSAAAPSSLNYDYKFPKFSNSAVSSACSNPASTSSLLHPSSFLSFKEKSQTHAQFPPPDAGGLSDDHDKPSLSASSSIIFKPVRLEPSSLSATANSALRLAQKHGSTADKCSSSTGGNSVCKEPKLIASSRLGNDCDEDRKIGGGTSSGNTSSSGGDARSHRKRRSSMDEKLTLTSEHLYRKETRVLTDMGGLFYAGVLKPLQPPDVYAITLDGERGNKPHIMSREEIFKDTILEVAPKSVESVPVGTRLCAYWSQQYRCLYPGRATGSESSEDGVTTPDFVSVEFDDGDSGRIRLQNIRFLLSDYPIAEYNDNPLYSLGKQKKASSAKSGHSTDPPHYQRRQQQQQHHHILHYDPSPSTSTSATVSSATASAIDVAHHHLKQLAQAKNAFAVAQLSDMDATNNNNSNSNNNHNNNNSVISNSNVGEFYARRTEKKRRKSLKKRSQAAAALILNGVSTTSSISTTTTGSAATDSANPSVTAASIATTITTTTNSTITVADLSECARKHHKHKKHKKHKKHHHRKNLIDSKDGSASFMISALGKRADEGQQQQQLIDFPVKHQTKDTISKNAPLLTSTPIKMEVSPVVPMNASGIKVKSENLDLEEETQSNMLSEISDEVKAEEEVEHNNSKGSKIAAFLPERQLWGWQGKAYRKAGVKGRARKQFYKSIKRGKETITVRDCAVFLSTGRPDRPYIGRIESMWETSSSNKVVRVRWFYHPEETIGCPNLEYPGALFESPHEDENDVQTISHRCEVLPFERYFNKFGADSKQYQSIYDNNDTYYLAGYYNPRLQVLKLEDDIPTLQEENTTIET